MSILYLPNDILQYIINPFIDYYSDKENLESIIHQLNYLFEFNIKPHQVIIKEYYDFEKKKIKSVETTIDDKIIIRETYNTRRKITERFRFKKYNFYKSKSILKDGLQEYYFNNGKLLISHNFHYGKPDNPIEKWYKKEYEISNRRLESK